ncbi:MAG: Hsp70 family protein [Candidatus Poribacteria bacterium]|nr:Hsp70 family protein [Candidatus Poribacteria bacterium]
MADKICSKCGVGWMIQPYDKYCGYCGCAVFGFSVKWKEEPWIYTDDSANIRDLTILIENTGAYPITFHPIRTSRDDTIQFLDVNDKPFEVRAGEFHAVQIQVKPTNLARFAETIAVRAKDAPSNFESEKSLTLQALPLPDFRITPSLVPLSYPKSKKKDTINFEVEFQEEQFAIESIESSNEWIIEPNLSEAPRNICLEIDCTKLKAGWNSGTLSFKLRGPSKPIEKQIQVQANIEKEPAELSVVGEELEIIQDRENSHTFRLRNKGEKPLTITKIECDDSSNLIKLQNDECPIIIEGVKQQSGEDKQQDEAAHNVDILISTVGTDPGTYPINFKIHSNCHISPEYDYTLNIKVKKREKYLHHLAIDFGTTNSCCAYIDDNDNFALKPIPLEESAKDDTENPSTYDPTIMPSSIIYRTESENGRDYDVGAKAETDRTDTRDGPYFISSVKRWLGYRWHRQFPNEQWQPVDVVSHILKHIIDKAEDYLEQQNIPSKIERCVITHPTKFNTSQQDALKQAFKKIGIIEENLKLIDEASAASMGIIFDNYSNLPEDYRLLVYDFGGGTIDIALSQVTKNGDDITIEPIARDGDPKYGGDDVTQAIVDYILSEYRRRIEEISPGHNFDIPYCGPGQVLQPSGKAEIDEATDKNSRTLQRRAEEMKIELGKLSETDFTLELDVDVGAVMTLPKFVKMILAEHIQDENVLTERTQSILNVKLSADQFQRLIAPVLNKTFAMIDTMIAENGGRLPDLIVLAGQSSRMRFVKEMMVEHFKSKYQQNIEIRLDDNPKTCVVMGAAEFGRPITVPYEESGTVKVVNLSNKTHTRIGITRIRRGIGSVFSEIIPKGKLIPEESFNTITFPLNSRQTSINVYEHFGSSDELDENQVSQIDNYVLDLKKGIKEEELRTAKLKMAVGLNGEIKLAAIVGDHEEPFTVKREKPEFVDEIPRTTSVIEILEQQPTSPYQREVEEVIQDTQQRVTELERNYQDGKPIDLDNIFISTPSQKVVLNLNTIARDLCQWANELKQDEQTDLLQTLRYAETAIKDKLKTIRGQAIPFPKTLELSTDVSTDTEVTHIRNECADYLEEYKSMLRKFELECEVDPSVCEQLVRNQLFNNLARYMPPDSLSEKLDKFLQLVDLEIVPIKIGETEVDSRIHVIQGSKKTNVDAGTVAEIIIPGLMQKTDSAIVQKPVVIRGE